VPNTVEAYQRDVVVQKKVLGDEEFGELQIEIIRKYPLVSI
jgi:hypothetical protein